MVGAASRSRSGMPPERASSTDRNAGQTNARETNAGGMLAGFAYRARSVGSRLVRVPITHSVASGIAGTLFIRSKGQVLHVAAGLRIVAVMIS